VIHHVSIPAKEPRHVATVLAQLIGGRILPFRGPLPGAFTVLTGDGQGSMIEVYPEDTQLQPKEGDNPIPFVSGTQPTAFHPWHVNLSVALEPDGIAAIAKRAGWCCIPYGAAPPGRPAVFHVTQVWVENRVMIELMSPSQTAQYVGFIEGLAAEAAAG